MLTIDTHHDFSAPPESLWKFIANFGDIEAWWPVGGPVKIDRVELEGQDIGMTRHMYNKGMPAPISERLDYLDPDSWTWRLSIVGERPAGIRRYQATGTITSLQGSGCRIDYHGEFEAEPGREEEARQFLAACYQLMFNGLEQAAGRQ